MDPDDRERVWKAIDRAVDKLEPFAFEERIVRPDGQTRVLYSQGRVIAGGEGTAAALVGVCHDVTVRSEAERALGESRRRLRAIIRSGVSGRIASTRSTPGWCDRRCSWPSASRPGSTSQP